MKNKKNIIFFFLLVFSFTCYSQISISGRVVDVTNTGIEFATIAVLRASDSSVIQSTYTDLNGAYHFSKMITGDYIFRFFLVGYSEKLLLISLDDQTKSIPDIILAQSQVNLNEITVNVIKKMITIKNGNLTFNTEGNALVSGNSVYDVLTKVPSVFIDDQSISIQGNSGARIYIDGRLQVLSNNQLIVLLKTMNSNLLTKIEVLANPPSKYDAAGTGGIINICTKKSTITGFNGSASLNSSQGFYNRNGGGLSLNYKANKFEVFTNASISNDIFVNWDTYNRVISDSNGNSILTKGRRSDAKSIGFVFRGGANYYVTKNTTIGFLIDNDRGDYSQKWKSITTESGNVDLGFKTLENNAYNPSSWNGINYNLNLQTNLDTNGSYMLLSSDYYHTTNPYVSNNNNYFYDSNYISVLDPNNFRINEKTDLDLYSGKLDFKKYLKAKTAIDAGVKASYVSTYKDFLFARQNNQTKEYNKDTTFSNNFLYDETILAGYLNVEKTIKKFTFQLGLRAENTFATGNNITINSSFVKKYFNLYPNISLDYKKSENHNFELNYNRRIDRPSYEDLNPFKSYADQYTAFEGNQYLQPQYSNKIEFAHSFKDFLNNSISFTQIDHQMVTIPTQNEATNEFLTRIYNINNYQNFSYNGFIQVNIRSWYSINASILVFYQKYNMKNLGINSSNEVTALRSTLTNEFLVSKSLKLQIGAYYNSPFTNGIRSVREIYSVSFGINKSLLKDKLIISIGVDDVFWTERYRSYAYTSTLNYDYLSVTDSRRIKLSASFNFGKTKITERETNSNVDEKDRL
jgi:hypothetical protein